MFWTCTCDEPHLKIMGKVRKNGGLLKQDFTKTGCEITINVKYSGIICVHKFNHIGYIIYYSMDEP